MEFLDRGMLNLLRIEFMSDIMIWGGAIHCRESNAGLGTSGVGGILPVGCPTGERQIPASKLHEMAQRCGEIDGGLSGAIGDVIFACLDGELEGIL